MECTNNIVQEVLMEKIYADAGMEIIKKKMGQSDDRLYSKISSAYRLCRSLEHIKVGKNSWHDLCGHLRQYILFSNSRFKINKWIYKNIKDIAYIFNLVIEDIGVGNGYEVGILNNMPNWFGDFHDLNSLYRLERFRRNEEVIGDGFLYNVTGYKTYRSSTQKILINAAMNMPEGSTLLGCMPTGEGKSLVGIVPQYYEEEGTTIVIVPTVALAIDQSKRSEYYYSNRYIKPAAYHSQLDSNDKKRIYWDLINGKIPLLYISPEAVLNSKFKDILLECAKKGYINRLIIDEAHIVEDWGSQFRTEFQLLSIYRRKLLEASNNKLKTILLSATFTNNTVDMLKVLFSEGDNYIEIRGDALRPEIQYFVDKNRTNQERISKIKQILPLLPRPIILYVIKPEDAENWKEEILNIGFKSVKTFTGRITNRNKREELMNQWNNDDIDIMVATSAFGMGIDKKDIRTIVHCCIPESINRFYQEVGRGGRDGFPSISLLSIMPSHDMEDSNYLIGNRVMTIEKFISRWDSMRKNHLERVSGNTMWVDTNTRPDYMEDITGRLSASWNEYVLLLLYREGYIDILDIMQDNATMIKKLLIKVKKDTLNDMAKLEIELEDIRKREADTIYGEFDEMGNIINIEKAGRCFAEYFNNVYPLVELSCGGCPVCRKLKYQPYSNTAYTDYYYGKEIIGKNDRKIIYSDLQESLNIKGELLFIYRESSLIEGYMEKLINYLMENGVDHIVLPYGYDIKKIDFDYLSVSENRFYNLLTWEEIKSEYCDYALYGTIGIIYPNVGSGVQECFRLGRRLYEEGCNIIHIANENTKLGDGALISERIDGSTMYR